MASTEAGIQQRYRQIRTTSTENYVYLDVELEFPLAPPATILDQNAFRLFILTALDGLFGEASFAIQFDLLKYRSSPTPRAYIRVLGRDYVRFRIALSTVNHLVPLQGRTLTEEEFCQFTFHKVAHSLSSLAFHFNVNDFIENEE